MSLKEIFVPDIGDTKDVDVIEINVKVGDNIAKDDTLIVVEGEKATMEIPSSGAGVVKEIKLKVGDKVSQGSLILLVEESASAAAKPAETKAAVASAPPVATAPAPAATQVPAPSATVSASASTSESIKVPDIGDAKDVDVIEVSVKVGDSVNKDDTLIVVEGEKATMEIPASFSGVIESLSIKVGDKVSQGSVIGMMKVSGGGSAAANPAAASTPIASTAPASSVVHAPMPSADINRDAPVPDYPFQRKSGDGKPVHASPTIRRFARELGVDLAKINATGPKGRVLKEDVQSFVKFELSRPKAVATGGGLGVPELPVIDYAKWGAVETTTLSRIQKISSVNLHRNWVTIPHVTQHEDADITEMEAFRQSVKGEAEKKGIKLTPLVFVMKAVVNTLKAFPTFNSSLSNDGETLVLKKYWHIGIAVDTPDGLVVPVVRDVDQKSIYELSVELAEISKKAREKKLGVDGMQGSTFTISSLGGIGGTYFTPIVAWPNVAILGLSRSSMKPVWDGKQFEPRLMLPMSLSYDHRVIDGAVGARFITHLASNLADMRRLLL